MRRTASLVSLLLLASLVPLATADVASWTVSTTSPASVLVTAAHPEPIMPFLATGSGPHPTNQFWTNFILGDGSSPVSALPYVFQVVAGGLGVTYPTIDADLVSVTASRVPEFVLTAQEPLDSHRVTAYDELSVRLEFPATAGSSAISLPIVRGAPFVTAVCTAITPVVNFIADVLSVNTYARGASVTDSRFIVSMQNGRVWALYTSEPVTILFRDTETLQFLSPYTGALRIAAVPSDQLLYLLDQHSSVYPVSASVNYTVTDFTADINFVFDTAGGDENSTELLMLALPHHYDTLVFPAVDSTTPRYTTFHSIIGEMREVLGSRWVLRESLPDFDWFAGRAPDPAFTDALRESLKTDAARLSADSADPYWLGRELASVARLAIIAEHLGENATAARCRDFVKSKLAHTLNSFAADALVYETKWGGVVTATSLYASVCDNGLGWYRDHLAQYGALLYSAAVVNRAEGGQWADDATRVAQELLVRDIANPSQADGAFPVTRHKDWYAGHSWGLGLEHNANGKSLAAVSEAAHAYYAVFLWASAAANTRLADLARVLCATELRALRRYWQTPSFRSVYDPVFSANKFVDSFSTLAVAASKQTLLHALAQQMRPVSPLLAFALYRPVVSDAYVQIRNALLRGGDLSASVQGYAFAALAQVEPEQSFVNIAALPAFDFAETRTNLLYWAATRLPYANASLPRVPSVAPAYSLHFSLAVDFAPAAPTASASATTGTAGTDVPLDSGEAFSEARTFGWLRGAPTLASRPLSDAYSAFYTTYARFDKSARWKAALPAAGDYQVRVVMVPPTDGRDKCGPLNVHTSAANDDVIATVGACPLAEEAMSSWTGVVTLPAPELVLSAEQTCASPMHKYFYFTHHIVCLSPRALDSSHQLPCAPRPNLVLTPFRSADVAFLEIFSADGSYLDITFTETGKGREAGKGRDTVRLPAALNAYLLGSALAAVTAQPAERFYVRSFSPSRANVLVLNARDFPGAASSYDVATTAQQAPLAAWARSGISINAIAISGAPSPVSPPSPSSQPNKYSVPAAIVVLTVIIGSLFIMGSVAAIVYLLRRRARDAREDAGTQEFRVVAASHSAPGSAAGSQVDLLQRTQSRSSLNTISPTASATALAEKAAATPV